MCSKAKAKQRINLLEEQTTLTSEDEVREGPKEGFERKVERKGT